MRKALTTTLTLTAVAALGLGLGPVGALAGQDHDRDRGGAGRGNDSKLAVIGLADAGTSLVSFSTNNPGLVRDIGAITGLTSDTGFIGIDYRVQNGRLYGVGDKGGLYTLNAQDAAAKKVGQLSVALQGVDFGVDFNPAANALRVISDTGQNLRQPFPAAVGGAFGDGPTAPTAVDGPLTRPVVPATTPPSTQPALGLTGAAYTNNDLDPSTATSLFDLDTARDQVTLQSPANSGMTAATGGLVVDFARTSGFDIYSRIRNGKTVEALPYAVSTAGGVATLYDVDLLTGAVESDGAIGDPTVTDIAIPLNQL